MGRRKREGKNGLDNLGILLRKEDRWSDIEIWRNLNRYNVVDKRCRIWKRRYEDEGSIRKGWGNKVSEVDNRGRKEIENIKGKEWNRESKGRYGRWDDERKGKGSKR